MFEPNELLTDTFRHYLGTTGLTNASFTKALYKDGAASGVAVTVTEIAGGFYSASFTPDSAGLWTLDVYETADTAAHYQGDFPVRALELDEVASDHVTAGTIGSYLQYIKAYVANKLSKSGSTYTVYKDDGVTPLQTGTTTTTERTPA